MSEDALPAGWEEVVADDGRVYWWNVDDNSTTWERPRRVSASKSIASDYLKRVSSSSAAASSQSRRAADAEPALPLDSVGALTRQFSNLSDGDAAPTSPKSPASPASPESEKKKAVSVTSLKKLREAKQLEAQREAAAPKRAPPPQVDLYK